MIIQQIITCWTTYLQPWLFTNKTAKDYKAYIQRHYLFYRGLLVLVITRLSTFPLNSEAVNKTVIESLYAMKKVYTDSVLEILSECEREINIMQMKQNSFNSSSLFKGDFISEGIYVRNDHDV